MGAGACAPAQTLAHKAALGPAPERAQSSQRRRDQIAPGSLRLLWGPWLSNELIDPMGRWGGSLGDSFPRGMVSTFNRVVRIGRSLGGLEVGPSQLGRCPAFSIPGTGRARARAAKLGLPFLDGAAPADRWVTDQPGLRARAGRKSLAQALDRSATQLLPSRAGQLFSGGAGTRRQVQARAQVQWAAGVADAGFQLLLGPGT